MTDDLPGEITVPCAADSTVARFVAQVDGLADDLKRELVLIGGLTVSCRLGFEHRVTNDVDGLYFNRSADAIEQVLIAHDVNTDGHRVVLDDGTKLDVIEVGDVDPAELPDDESERLFIEAHRWAYDSATTERITALDPITRAAHSTVTIRLAHPAALLPMKLRAAEARAPQQREEDGERRPRRLHAPGSARRRWRARTRRSGCAVGHPCARGGLSPTRLRGQRRGDGGSDPPVDEPPGSDRAGRPPPSRDALSQPPWLSAERPGRVPRRCPPGELPQRSLVSAADRSHVPWMCHGLPEGLQTCRSACSSDLYVVDEYLAIRSLLGVLPEGLPDEPLAITTSAHWRLLQRVHAPAGGQLSQALAALPASDREALRFPHREVLDPRSRLDVAAQIAARFGRTGWLIAETITAGLTYGRQLWFGSDRHVGVRLREIADESGIEIHVAV